MEIGHDKRERRICNAYFAVHIKAELENEEKIPLALFYGIFFEFIMLFASRLCYSWFDYVLTRFDTSLYTYYPNILFWKLGSILGGMGVAGFLFGVERVVLLRKTRYLLTLVLMVTLVIQFVYPVRSGNNEDATFETLFGSFGPLFGFLVIIIFVWLGIVTQDLENYYGCLVWVD
ncbi:MAG TPA: hypothetical protein VKM55_10275 [Candidatus Lokiarchaeia archaeon]|nr:hypothetical protein [Candidatus Lokiarchaeia archaeon]